MGTGYTRNDTADNIADGNIINASDLDGEFDALQSAFDNSSGHTHDGTAGEGAPVEKVGPNQEVVVTTAVLRPAANNTIDLGVETSNEFKNLYIDGTAYLDAVDIDGGTIDGLSILTVDNLSLNGNTITSTDTDGNLNLRANGDGIISVDATDVNFGDNDKATFGDGSDLSITHNGTNSIITDSGTGSLLLRGNNVSIQNAAGNETVAQFVEDSFVKLYYDNSEVFSTITTGISVTGDVDASDDLILSSDSSKITFGADGDVELEHIHNYGLTLKTTGTGDNAFPEFRLQSNEDTIIADEIIGRIDFDTNSTAGGASVGVQARITVGATDTYSSTVAGSRMEFYTTASNGALTKALQIEPDQSIIFTGGSNVTLDATNNTLDFPDNFKIMVGSGDDLQIYHDGNDSYIREGNSTSGNNLHIQGANILLQDPDGNEFIKMVDGGTGGTVILKHDTAAVLTTASTGVDITGAFTATAGSTITVGDNSVALDLICTDTDASQGPILRLSRDVVGAASDIIGTIQYYGQDVAGNDAQYVELEARIEDATDGSEEGRLDIKVLRSGTARSILNAMPTETVVNDGSQDLDFRVESNGNANMLFVDAGNSRVGVGTNAPAAYLHVNAGVNNLAGLFESTDAGATITLIDNGTTGGSAAEHGLNTVGDQLEIRAVDNLSFETATVERLNINSTESVFNEGGNDVDFRVESDNDVNAFFVQGSDGSCGIGTNSPTVSLDVVGTGRFVKTNNDSNLILETTDTDANTGPKLELLRNPSEAGADNDLLGLIQFRGLNDASEDTRWAEFDTRIVDASNGTEDGRTQLVVIKDGTLVNAFNANMGLGEIVINDGSKDINFRVESDNDEYAFFIDGADGNIGMSINNPSGHIPVSTNPDKRSFVSHNAGGSQVVMSRSDTIVLADDYIGGYLFKTNDASGNKFGGMVATVDDNAGNGNLEFYPVTSAYDDGSEGSMQLDDAGDLYLRAGGIKVGRSHGGATASTEENVIIYHTGSGSADTSTAITSRDGTGGDNVFRHIYRGTVKSEIEENGDFLSATDSFTSTSDGRLKENIVDSGSQWDDIKALQIKKYSFIEDGLDAPDKIGVIAQDLLAAGMTGLVKQKFKTDAEDNPILDADGNHDYFYTVKGSVMQMKALKALQEAMAKIEVLEAKVAALEAE